jgi:hypothetical protein
MEQEPTADWLRALRWYLGMSLGMHGIWEILQLPLYTLWRTGSLGQQAFAVLHCTIGDVMIAGLSLLVAFALAGRACWPSSGSRPVWLLTLLLGAGYTVYSEWLNVNVRGSWAYSDLMPAVPIIGTGLAPLLQWFVVPTLVLWVAARRAPWVERARSRPQTATLPEPYSD